MKKKITNNHLKLISNINKFTVLKTIMESGPISRIDISKKTDISPTTVTNMTEQLIKEGWLCEGEEGVSSGGRKPILLAFNNNARFIIGVQVTPKVVRGVIYNLGVIEEYRTEKSVKSLGRGIVDGTIEVIGHLMDYAQKHLLEIFAIGINTPGAVNVKTGTLAFATDLELENVRFRAILEEKFGINVYVQNDANLAALAEKTYGIGKNENSMVYIKDLGGAGIVINGEIYIGFNGVAGEFGHISIDKNGERCKCGNYGCLYQYVSEMALEASVIKAMKQGCETSLSQLTGNDYNLVTAELVIKAANEGDKLARRKVGEIAENLGVGIVSLVNILDIRLIVIGGVFAKAGDYFLGKTMETFRNRTAKMPFKNIRIVSSELKEDIGLLGCVCMVMKETFKFPARFKNS